LALSKELAAEDPAVPEYRHLLGSLHHALAQVLQTLGRPAEVKTAYEQAVQAFREALPLHQRRAADSPGPENRWHLADCYDWLAESLRPAGQLAEALQARREATFVVERLVNDFNFPDHRALLGQLHGSMGSLLSEIGRHEEAETAFGRAIVVLTKLVDDLNRPEDCASLASIKVQRSEGQRLAKRDAVIAPLRDAIALDPKSAGAHTSLASALLDQNKADEAVAHLRAAIELDPEFAFAHRSLGNVLRKQNKLDDAIDAYRKAIALDPGSADARVGLSTALGLKGWELANSPDVKIRDHQRAVKVGTEAVDAAPQSDLAWQYLGWVQYRAGDWKASIEALEKSCKLQEGGTGDCCQWFVLALDHWKLANEKDLPAPERIRHRAEAHRWYEQAVKQIDTWGPGGSSVMQATRAFRAEAAVLLEAKEKGK
jgi:tetratricopeptide (TPR) repeat protein